MTDPTLEGVLFDLDGTLLDTHRDMAAALNTVLQRHGHDPLEDHVVRPFVSRGAMVLVCLAFKCQPGSEQAKSLWREYLDVYEQDIRHHTALFPGMDEVLDGIESAALPWGIVTNKPEYLAAKLLGQLDLRWRPGCVVGGDTLVRRKPDPLPLVHCCEQLSVNPRRCVYIGDDERDVIAGREAGMTTMVARYGYIVDEDNPEEWNADVMVSDCAAMHAWIRSRLPPAPAP